METPTHVEALFGKALRAVGLDTPHTVGRLSTNPVKRNLSRMAAAGVTAVDLHDAKRTKRYADGRQKFTLSHIGRPTRITPQPSQKAKNRQAGVKPTGKRGWELVTLSRGQMKRALHGS